MKKIFTLSIISLSLLSLTACGNKNTIEEKDIVEIVEEETDVITSATFNEDNATKIDTEYGEFYVDNNTESKGDQLFFKIKFVPKDKNITSIKFDLFTSYEGMYLDTFRLEENLDSSLEDHKLYVKEYVEGIIPKEDLEDIDLSNLEFDIKNIEVK